MVFSSFSLFSDLTGFHLHNIVRGVCLYKVGLSLDEGCPILNDKPFGFVSPYLIKLCPVKLCDELK